MNEQTLYYRYDPIRPLLNSNNKAIITFTYRDLLDINEPVKELWQLPGPLRILRKQDPMGYWFYPGASKRIAPGTDYTQLETYRNLGILVEEFGFTKEHPAIRKAAAYFFSLQSPEGDFRGIYGRQYSPNYTAGITELLIKAGYAKSARIEKGLRWLLSIRQQDGGWAIPFRTRDYKLSCITTEQETIEPDTTQPSSHMVTGVVLRAFAAHPDYRLSSAAYNAGKLLVSRLFRKDTYADRASSDYWLKFSFPFWYTDLISALDTLSLLKFSQHEIRIRKGLEWLANHQEPTGQWKLKLLKGRDKDTLELWLTLAICRIFSRFKINASDNSSRPKFPENDLLFHPKL